MKHENRSGYTDRFFYFHFRIFLLAWICRKMTPTEQSADDTSR